MSTTIAPIPLAEHGGGNCGLLAGFFAETVGSRNSSCLVRAGEQLSRELTNHRQTWPVPGVACRAWSQRIGSRNGK